MDEEKPYKMINLSSMSPTSIRMDSSIVSLDFSKPEVSATNKKSLVPKTNKAKRKVPVFSLDLL